MYLGYPGPVSILEYSLRCLRHLARGATGPTGLTGPRTAQRAQRVACHRQARRAPSRSKKEKTRSIKSRTRRDLSVADALPLHIPFYELIISPEADLYSRRSTRMLNMAMMTRGDVTLPSVTGISLRFGAHCAEEATTILTL